MMRQNRSARPAHAAGKTPRGGVARKLRGLAAAVFVAVAVLVAVPVLARASVTDPKYTVQGVSPNGTTIDLFDYWANNVGPSNDSYNLNQGINAGHQLKFNTGSVTSSSDLINSWTNKGNGPRTGMVMNTLQDGYPSLANTTLTGWANTGGNGSYGTETIHQESLAYLWDSSDVPGKATYPDVQDLLQVDADGYYYYNASSTQVNDFGSANFATYNEDTNSFTLFNTYAVNKTGEYSSAGQFFPFANPDTVFTESNGQLQRKNIQSNNASLNHYFGMHMSTQFVQQYGGHVDDSADADVVTYEFSGDDDVWIYIDDVLVGDLGGIHDAVRISINFNTGDITVTDSAGRVVTPNTMKTLKACYEAAGEDGNYTWNGSTFADNTYHTLDFFYLERGASDSNMSLKYNLVSIPETQLSKVDQQGNFIDGAVFSAYDTTGGKTVSPENLICENAVTEADGTVTLIGKDDYPITIDRLYADGVRNITLVETTVPGGYRGVTEIPLYIEHYTADQTGNKQETNLLLSESPWTTGAYAQPKVTATTTGTVTVDTLGDLTSEDLQNGILFAVVEQKGADGAWYPVTGNALDGWTVSSSNSMAEIIKAGQATNAPFAISTSGAYQTEIANLPGRIQQYQFFAGDDAVYRGAYYYTTSSTWAGADDSNTYEVTNADSFDRQFSARIYLSNIINRVLVQKTDQDGNPVDGATMALFEEGQVTVNDDGSATLNADATPIDGIEPVVTRTLSKDNGDSIDLEGAAIFTNLKPGTYYAAEVKAPDGYVKSNAAAKIIVNDNGVYADAGAKGDGVTVTRGVGRLVRSMVQFATNDSIDSTLHNIVATEQVGETVGDWTDVKGTDGQPVQLHLTYSDDGDAVLDYDVTPGTTDNRRFTVDEGIPNLKVQQCRDHTDTQNSPAQDLGTTDITPLFTGVTIVTIENQQVGALDVTKTVAGDNASANATFDFTVTFSHPGAGGAEATPLTQAEATAADMKLAVGDEQAQAVTVGDAGEVTFELTAGQTAHLTNIPAGVTYKVTEAATAGYTTTYDNAQSGTIAFNQTAATTVTNTVVPDAVLNGAENLEVTKNLVGREWQDGDSFSFTLAADPEDEATVKAVEDGTVVLPDNADDGSVVVSNETQGDPKTAAFGDITFKSEGTYKFIVTENDSDVTGVSKDASTKHVTVSVTDENGTLEANVVTDESDALTFTNTADLTVSAADALRITKNLHASAETAGLVNAEAGAYQFTIKAVATEGDGQPTAADAAAKLGLADGATELTADSAALTQGSGDNAYVWSGSSNPLTNDLTFTAADRGKTFTYEVSEVVPNPTADGYVYDTATHTVTYTVSDDATAALSVEVRIDGGDPVAADATPTVTFDNAIKVATIGGDGADTALKVQKTVNVATDKDFAFDLTLASAKDGEDNDITGAVFEIGDDGALTAFDGMTATVDGAFNADNKLTQTASFDKITFTKPGTYTFNVKETTTGTGDGWTYDTSTKTITVTVGNDMNVTVNPANATVSFTNTYGASGNLPLDGSGAIKLTKKLTGRDWVDGDTFTFTLSGKNVTPGADETAGFELPATTEVTVSYADAVKAAGEDNATEGVAVPFGFDKITFTQTGTYEFTVTEGDIDEEHVSNMSGTSVTYRVVVEDKTQDGKLEVGTPVVTTQTGSIAFVNVYNPDAALAGLTATKTVNGKTKGLEAGLFTFQIKAVSAPDGVTAPMPSNAQAAGDGTYTVTNDVDGAINFGTFRFTEAGTYTYTVSEVAGNQTGVTYDDSTFTVTYDVADHPETGELLANATYYRGSEALPENAIAAEDVVFANTYDPEDVTVDPTPGDASTGFSGTKTVTNEHGEYGALEAGDFQFTMKNVVAPAGVTAPDPSNGSTVDVKADGSFDFGTLTFTEPGTYTYEVREVSGNEDGVTYSDAVYTLSYTIEDQDGKLTVTDSSITNADGTAVDGTALNFENIYNDGQTEYTIGGTKVLETNGYQGASLTEGAYTFVLVDENGDEVGRVTNGAATDNTATFQFDPITYTEAGTHTYTVYELGADGQPGTGGTDDARVTHSDAVYTVTVTVTESNDGRGLAASADVQNADITFTNTYEPTPVVVGPNGSAKIEGTKVLNVTEGNDRTMKAGEFEFLLLQNDQEVSRTTNDENGNFVFDDITFDKAGTYTYAVSEIGTGLGGIAYDSTVYTVTVEVTENADTHALEATVSYTDPADISKPVDAMTFTNSYKATGTTIVLGASKELKNGTLADGQFTFEITGSEGAPMPESTKATNLADGSVSFGTVTFDKVGEYDYTITEVNDGQDGITYDEDATRTIHVSVTDSGEGYLTAYVTFGADGSHFVNTSTSTTVPGTGDGTGTGDGSGSGDTLVGTGGFLLGATALVAIAGAGAVTAGAVMRRRKR